MEFQIAMSIKPIRRRTENSVDSRDVKSFLFNTCIIGKSKSSASTRGVDNPRQTDHNTGRTLVIDDHKGEHTDPIG